MKINFAGAASDKAVSAYDPTPRKERYYNKVAEIWYSPKEAMRTGQIKGLCGEVIQEMCMRKKTEKLETQLLIRIESKREMMLHTEKSPDLADAAMGLCELCCERLSFNSGTATRELYPQEFTKPFKKMFSKLGCLSRYPRAHPAQPLRSALTDDRRFCHLTVIIGRLHLSLPSHEARAPKRLASQSSSMPRTGSVPTTRSPGVSR